MQRLTMVRDGRSGRPASRPSSRPSSRPVSRDQSRRASHAPSDNDSDENSVISSMGDIFEDMNLDDEVVPNVDEPSSDWRDTFSEAMDQLTEKRARFSFAFHF